MTTLMNRKTSATCVVLLVLITVVSAFPSPALMGTLRTRQNRAIRLNGANSKSGRTVLSGARIQCPAEVGATVDLGPLGRVDIAPESELVLHFSTGSVTITLASGHLVLTTKEGVKGSVTTPDGHVAVAEPGKSLMVRTVGSVGPETAATQGAGIAGGAKTAIGIGAAGAAVVGGAAAARSNDRSKSVSPNKP